MFVASPGPSEGSFEPKWCCEGKIADGMTNGLDFKEVCLQTGQGGLPGPTLPRSAESRPLAQHYFTIGLGVHLNHALSKKKPEPGLATCFFVC